MKLIGLKILLLILSINVSGQSKKTYSNAKITYGINIHLDKNSDVYKIHEKFMPGLVSKAEKADEEVDFILVVNDTISIFYMEKKLFSDNRAIDFVIGESGFFGRVKQYPNKYLTEELQEDFGKFLVSRSYNKWQLLDETKKIGDYLCFKATTFNTIVNSKGKVFKHNFTAWYAPQLPYNFGPAGYGNLPGLIIELQSEKFTYGVKKIEFYEKDLKSKENLMPKLKNKKLITEDEFEKLAAEDEKRWRSKN